MDSQSKSYNGGMDGVERREMMEEGRGKNWSLLGLRILAMVFTLASSIVLGVNKQTKVVPIVLVDSLPPMNVPVQAKWHYLSAFVFFVVANAIACTYAAVSLLLAIGSKKRSMGFIIITLDLLMVALLFSGNGAATAIGLMGYKGNSHVRWNKVCNVFGRFCNQVAASVVISLLGSIAFVLLSASRLRSKKSH